MRQITHVELRRDLGQADGQNIFQTIKAPGEGQTSSEIRRLNKQAADFCRSHNRKMAKTPDLNQ